MLGFQNVHFGNAKKYVYASWFTQLGVLKLQHASDCSEGFAKTETDRPSAQSFWFSKFCGFLKSAFSGDLMLLVWEPHFENQVVIALLWKWLFKTFCYYILYCNTYFCQFSSLLCQLISRYLFYSEIIIAFLYRIWEWWRWNFESLQYMFKKM